MKEQNDSAAPPMALARKIDRWDYDKSVIKMRELAVQWQKVTAEVARELFLAKEHLGKQKGQRKDPDAPNYIQYTWKDYCEEIGISREVADYWIKKFIPREISGTSKDVLLIKAPPKEDTTASRALMQARINEYLRTGNRPADFTDEEEEELRRQLKNAQYEELAADYHWKDVSSIHDYFSDAMRRSKDVAAFRLEDTAQIQAQLKVFKYIESYLAVFDDTETRALAALNLALKTKDIANKLAEENFQTKESAQQGGGA